MEGFGCRGSRRKEIAAAEALRRGLRSKFFAERKKKRSMVRNKDAEKKKLAKKKKKKKKNETVKKIVSPKTSTGCGFKRGGPFF